MTGRTGCLTNLSQFHGYKMVTADRLVHKVSDMRVFRAIEERIRHGTSWESTEFYKDAIGQIERGRVLYECTDRASFTTYPKLVELPNRIRLAARR